MENRVSIDRFEKSSNVVTPNGVVSLRSQRIPLAETVYTQKQTDGLVSSLVDSRISDTAFGVLYAGMGDVKRRVLQLTVLGLNGSEINKALSEEGIVAEYEYELTSLEELFGVRGKAGLVGIQARWVLLEDKYRTGVIKASVNIGQKNQELLSIREKQVLQLISSGKTSKEIGRLLTLSPKTVENHRSRMFEKFGVNSSIQLINMVRELGII